MPTFGLLALAILSIVLGSSGTFEINITQDELANEFATVDDLRSNAQITTRNIDPVYEGEITETARATGVCNTETLQFNSIFVGELQVLGIETGPFNRPGSIGVI